MDRSNRRGQVPRRRSDNVAQTIRRSLNGLMIATAVLYVALFAVAGWTFSTSQGNSEALCALRADVQARVDSAQTLLNDNPNGVSGLSAKSLADGIANQQRTVIALSGLKC